MTYKIQLEKFEGPLDLLLYLIKKDEIDIYDIPIAEVTEQYIQYIELMKVLDLDGIGDCHFFHRPDKDRFSAFGGIFGRTVDRQDCLIYLFPHPHGPQFRFDFPG